MDSVEYRVSPTCDVREIRIKDKPFYSAYWQDKDKFRWSFDDVAAMAPPGWRKILEELTTKLFHLGWDGGIFQVKEKFGTLRFYSGGTFPSEIGSEIGFDVISAAENRSAQVCQYCGEYGKVRGNGWLACLCQKCATEHDYPLFDWEKSAETKATETSTV